MDDAVLENSEPQRAFTLKSMLFGLLGILIIAGLAGYHDSRITSFPPMVGSHIPASGYSFIVIVALLWNLIWSRKVPALVLNSKELMVVMGMTLMASFPPTSGLMRYFPRQLILPWHHFSSGARPEWASLEILDYVPAKLWPKPVPAVQDGVLQLDDTVYRGFVTGLAKGSESLGIHELPLQGWIQPLLYWGSLIVLMSICVMSLSLLVHRQWAHHEQLSYPLAQVASSFIGRKKGIGVSDVFRSRLFWWGFIPIFSLYALQYLHLWFDESVPAMSEVLPNFKTWNVNIAAKMPVITKAPEWGALQWQSLMFSVVGLAYFVSAEISLTMGLSTMLLVGVGLWYFAFTGTPLSTNDVVTSRSGAYIGYALILLYTGRTYYLAVFKKAFGFGKAKEHEETSIMAARLVMLSFSAFVVLLVMMSIDWMIALFFALTLMLLFLVFTRILCETGVPFMQPNWMPGALIASILGPAAIGPGPLVMIMYVGSILCQDPRECLMPFVATSIKMADDAKIRIKRIFWLLVIAVVVAVSVSFLSSTWTMYNFGGVTNDIYASVIVPTQEFDGAAKGISQMKETGVFEESAAAHGLAKLRFMQPDASAMGWLFVGMMAVVLFSGLRFRFARFPLHPVLFLVWGTYPANGCWSSFLLGWAIKGAVVRFGGGKVYQKLKPVFIGMIAGELLAAGFSMFFEIVYSWTTGKLPLKEGFSILMG